MKITISETEYYNLLNKAYTSAALTNSDLVREVEKLKTQRDALLEKDYSKTEYIRELERKLSDEEKKNEEYSERMYTINQALDRKYFKEGFYKVWVMITTVYLIASIVNKIFGSFIIPILPTLY